ncbi:MAG TPA: TraB/GumN family protein [Myxococcota bacterium]|nr:TraB/GumN family protein [Myxococcota bacterium]
MRALALALALSLAGALPAAARDDPPPSAPTLWRALRANGGEAYYLIGSVHLGRRAMLRFPRAVDDAYQRSAELVLEVGAEGLRPEVAKRLAERYAWIEPPATLHDRVSSATITALSRYLTSRRDALAPYLQMQPWFIAQQIEAREAARVGLEAAFGVDRHFAARAARTKPVVGLETAESQMQILAWLPRATQEALLVDTIEHARDTRNGSEGVARAWARGDDKELERILYRAMYESPQLSTYYEQMLLGRNESMTERLASLARDGKLRFAVIGAGHMVGERGIPALLRDYGFRVDRVR